jgi:hypothetical protein
VNVITPNIVGIAWYKAEHYDAILRIMSDRHVLPRTFIEWRLQAEAAEKKYQRMGKTVCRALIDPEAFAEWCRTKGLNIDAQARMQYASAVAYTTFQRGDAAVQ